jgi:hypothetical protein
MSYSFTFKATSREDAKRQLGQQFDAVVKQQATHDADRAAAQAATERFIDTINEPQGGQQIHVTVYGSIGMQASTNPDQTNANITNVSVNIGVSVA